MKEHESMTERERGLTKWFGIYDGEAPHEGSGYRTPGKVYRKTSPEAQAREEGQKLNEKPGQVV